MRINRNIPEYHLALGDCIMHLGRYKEAVTHFSFAVINRPKNIAYRESLINCLYKAEFWKAANQCIDALQQTEGKAVFILCTVQFCSPYQNKRSLASITKGLNKSPKLVKNFLQLNPSILQNNAVVDLFAQYKKAKI